MWSNIYDPRNTINDLTWSERKFSTKTVISKAYPINMQHKLRSQHWWQKPPELCADLIKIFSKKWDLILDPFMWVWWTLLWCSLTWRQWIWIDITEKWIEIYKEVSKLESLEEQETILWDSLTKLDKIQDESIDFVLTDVPYWNIDTLKQTRNTKRVKESKLSNFENESEWQTKEEWLDQTSAMELLDACYSILGDFRLENKHYSYDGVELEIIFYHENWL